jgi:polyphenol oxidase
VSLSLCSRLLTGYGFRHGFSLREGGVSAAPFASLNLGRSVGDEPAAVSQNLARLAADIGYAAAALYEVEQVHGGAVEHVDPSLPPEVFRSRSADALVSASAGCPVAVRVADCAAVLLADRASGAVAAVHAGWRGVVAELACRAVQALSERHGSAPNTLLAAIFPCIGPDAFEVGDEVAQQIALAARSDLVVRAGRPRPHVDLALALRLQLQNAGLAASHIETVAGCTFTEPARFYSYRRDGGITGRHLAVIVPRC